MSFRSRATQLLGVPFALLAFACGGDKPEPAPAAPPAPAPAAEPAPAAATPQAASQPATPDAEGIVRLTGSDQMRYSATRIEVKAGSKIRIELKNAGTLPKDLMGHNLVVLKPGSDITAFAAKATTARATDYIPAEGKDLIVANTKLLGPGESALIEIESLAAGIYPFLCTFPGHVAIMNGQLVVQ